MKHYAELILHSTLIHDKFRVEIIDTYNILDFKSCQFYKENATSTDTQSRSILRESRVNFSVFTYMEFIYLKKHVGQVKTKTFIGGLHEHTFDLKNRDLVHLKFQHPVHIHKTVCQ